MKKVQVNELFVIKDAGNTIVHLASFLWDFDSYADVELCFPEKRIGMKCVGCGDQKGVPVLTLEPKGGVQLSEIASLWRGAPKGVYVQRDDDT